MENVVAAAAAMVWLLLAVTVWVSDARGRQPRESKELRARKQARKWALAASQLDLTFDAGTLHGVCDDFDVRVWIVMNLHGDPYTRITLQDRRGQIPRTLTLAIEHHTPGQPASDISTGDRVFDQVVSVHGEAPTAMALLDQDRRKLVMREIGKGVVLRSGQLSCEMPGVTDAGILVLSVRGMIELARALRLELGQETSRLAANACHDPDPEVQVGNLATLVSFHPQSAGAREASRLLLHSVHPRLRLTAAAHLGEDGFEVLNSLVASGDIEVAIRCQALLKLTEAFGDRAEPALHQALGSTEPMLLEHAVSCLERFPLSVPLGDLRNALSNVADVEVAVRVIALLRRRGDFAAEATLVHCLRLDEGVRVAAIAALAEMGSVAAVEPLLECANAPSSDPQSRAAAREAIERIQARLGDVEEGRLSLAEPNPREGGLSLTEEAGKLSLAGSSAASELQQASTGWSAPAEGILAEPPERASPDAPPASSAQVP